MKILIVSATGFEVEPTALFLQDYPSRNGGILFQDHEIHLLSSGVGMVATAFALGRIFSAQKFDLALNVGIAGSFSSEIALGEVVEVKNDVFSELGAQDDEHFIRIDDLGFGRSAYHSTFVNDVLPLRPVAGITVNSVHGHEGSIELLKTRLDADVESMEGAAFFYSCEASHITSLQIRAISNYVERRNRERWNIPLAVQNLNQVLLRFLDKLH